MKSFIRKCEERKVPVGIVLFPLAEARTGLEYRIDRVLTVCGQESIPCLDLRAAFEPYRDGRALWVNRFDSHPNAFAHSLAADEIMDAFGKLWMTGAPI